LRIRLVKKLAEVLNDVDLTDRTVGEVFSCPPRDAKMLRLEGWAVLVDGPSDLPDLSRSDHASLENAQLSQSIWHLIDMHREGKKDKLA
jgi:hypothetical protein